MVLKNHSLYMRFRTKVYIRSPNSGFCVKNRIGNWEHSSAGLEHLPYKQRVAGSNPAAPTEV